MTKILKFFLLNSLIFSYSCKNQDHPNSEGLPLSKIALSSDVKLMEWQENASYSWEKFTSFKKQHELIENTISYRVTSISIEQENESDSVKHKKLKINFEIKNKKGFPQDFDDRNFAIEDNFSDFYIPKNNSLGNSLRNCDGIQIQAKQTETCYQTYWLPADKQITEIRWGIVKKDQDWSIQRAIVLEFK